MEKIGGLSVVGLVGNPSRTLEAIAYHETGHAIMNYIHGFKVDLIYVFERSDGYRDGECRSSGRTLATVEDYRSRIDILAAGFAAEGIYTVGAAGDLKDSKSHDWGSAWDISTRAYPGVSGAIARSNCIKQQEAVLRQFLARKRVHRAAQKVVRRLLAWPPIRYDDGTRVWLLQGESVEVILRRRLGKLKYPRI